MTELAPSPVETTALAEASLPQTAQDRHNRELLRQSKFGVVLERAYEAATAIDSRLAEVAIVPLADNDPRLAVASPAWAGSNELGMHAVRMPLNDIDAGLKKLEATTLRSPFARTHFAEKMGISEDELTPEAMVVFGLLHELGHVTEFIDNEPDPQALIERNRLACAALPIPNTPASLIMTEGTSAYKYVHQNWDSISVALGVSTIEELLEKQRMAYRQMPAEIHADTFAEKVFRQNPALIDELLARQL